MVKTDGAWVTPEPYVGRWSRLVAAEFLEWLPVPANAGWLDVGCGTGALSETILERAAPREVVGVDAAEPFVEFAQSRLRDPRAEVRLGDAKALPCDDAEFHAAVAGLVLNFVPDPAQARKGNEASRAARRHGRRLRLGLRPRTPSSHANGGGRRHDSALGPRFRGPRGAAHLRTN